MIALLKKLHFYFIRGLFLIESQASKYIETTLTLGGKTTLIITSP